MCFSLIQYITLVAYVSLLFSSFHIILFSCWYQLLFMWKGCRSVYEVGADIKFTSRQTYCPSGDRKGYFPLFCHGWELLLETEASPQPLMVYQHSKQLPHNKNTRWAREQLAIKVKVHLTQVSSSMALLPNLSSHDCTLHSFHCHCFRWSWIPIH